MPSVEKYLLSLIVLAPAAGALLLIFVPSHWKNAVRAVATVVSLAVLLLSLYIAFAYDRATAGFQFVEEYPWLSLLGVTFKLAVDGISVPLLLLTGIVLFAGALVSWSIQYRNKDFFILLLLLSTGVLGVFATVDLFFLFFFYELAVVPMYLLIGVWGSSSDFGAFVRTKEYGAMKLTIYLSAGSVLVWVALIAIYVQAGLSTFDLLKLEGATFDPSFQKLFFPFLMVGFGILAGLWPFHTWSPDGHVAAPTAVSMLHAGVLMKLGAYGILRVGMELLPEGTAFWAPLLIGLGTVNVIYGAISAMGQRDLKYVVGYSSVSHMGYVLMGLGTIDRFGLDGAVLQMFSHGIMTALLFALVGVVYDRAHLRDIDALEGLAKRMGLTASFFVVAGLTSLGLPGLSGFVAELLIFVGAFRTYPVFAVFAVIGIAITAVYILRLLSKVFFGPLSPRWEHLPDMSRTEAVAAGALSAVLVAVGVAPLLLTSIIDVGVGDFLQRFV